MEDEELKAIVGLRVSDPAKICLLFLIASQTYESTGVSLPLRIIGEACWPNLSGGRHRIKASEVIKELQIAGVVKVTKVINPETNGRDCNRYEITPIASWSTIFPIKIKRSRKDFS